MRFTRNKKNTRITGNKIIKIPYVKSSIFAVIKIASLLNENSAINVPGMFL